MAHVGDVGTDFAKLIQHVRDMYELLSDALASAGDTVPQEARAVAEQLGSAIENMEQVLRDGGSTH